jgi:hypothetical protein
MLKKLPNISLFSFIPACSTYIGDYGNSAPNCIFPQVNSPLSAPRPRFDARYLTLTQPIDSFDFYCLLQGWRGLGILHVT